MEITGRLLKEKRESLKLSINEVATATKINSKVIAAIESGDLSNLPPKSFLRGFVRSYALYLKMDVEQVLNTFHEEMGKTTPQPDASVVPNRAWPKKIPRLRQASITSRTVAVIGIVVLIGLIVGVKEVVQKYEKEGVIAEPPADVVKIEPAANENKALLPDPAEPSDTETSEALEETMGSKEKVKDASLTPAPPVAAQTPPTTTEKATVNTTPAPSPSPEKKEVVKANEQAQKPEASADNKPAEKPEVTTATSHEIIVEALDKVQVSFSIDGGAKKKITLNPEQIHTFKAKSNLALELSDGGVVNVIHNGRDKGVPGDLGKPKTVKYP